MIDAIARWFAPPAAIRQVETTTTCEDCGAAFLGSFSMVSHGTAALAWVCPACFSKYPTARALHDRLRGASLRRFGALAP